MTRVNVVLLVALIASCLYLVKVSYESRRLFSALDRARAESVQLAADHERLQSERQAQATPLRVERVARERLAMRSATPAVTEYVEAPRAASAAAAEVGR
ncbi:MAG TPA: cell division protein FtsL [Methylibium sp.]|nr:cell division protein FtsL [Methylibium sp.]